MNTERCARARAIGQAVVLLVALILLSQLGGCSAMRPTGATVELEHVSHPLAGWPTGPSNEEDGLSQVSGLLEWDIAGFRLQQGLGYKLEQGGFKGPELTYTGRISRTFRFGVRR